MIGQVIGNLKRAREIYKKKAFIESGSCQHPNWCDPITQSCNGQPALFGRKISLQERCPCGTARRSRIKNTGRHFMLARNNKTSSILIMMIR